MNKTGYNSSIISLVLAIIGSIVLAALKLDGRIHASWMTVVIPLIAYVVVKAVEFLAILFFLGFVMVRKVIEKIREDKENGRFYNRRVYGKPLYWDSHTKSMYDAKGWKIEIPEEEIGE